jgi:hypothetical protein
MTAALDRLNLRPQERRLVVVVATVVFVVLNWLFVVPRFKDWGNLRNDIDKAHRKLALFQGEVARLPQYETTLKSLERSGASVRPEEQDNVLISAIQTQAAQSLVRYTGVQARNLQKAANAVTNQFFDEKTVFVSFEQTGDKELLDFLLSLGSGDLLVRVRDLDIKADPRSGGTKLMGSISLVASYQKKPAAASKPPPAKKP